MDLLINNIIKNLDNKNDTEKFVAFEKLRKCNIIPTIAESRNANNLIDFPNLPDFCVIAGINAYKLYIKEMQTNNIKIYIIGDYDINYKQLRSIIPKSSYYESSKYLLFNNFVIVKKPYKNIDEILYKQKATIEKIIYTNKYFYYTYDFKYCIANNVLYLPHSTYTGFNNRLKNFKYIFENDNDTVFRRSHIRLNDTYNNFNEFINGNYTNMDLINNELKINYDKFGDSLPIYKYVANLMPNSDFDSFTRMPAMEKYIDVVNNCFEKKKEEIINLIINHKNPIKEKPKPYMDIKSTIIILLVVLKKNNIKIGKFILFKFIELIFFFDLAKKIVNRLPRLNFTYFIYFIKYNNIAFFSKIKYIFKESFSVFFKWTGYSYRF